MRIYRHSHVLPDKRISWITSQMHFGFCPEKKKICIHGIAVVASGETMIRDPYVVMKQMDKQHWLCLKLPFPLKNKNYKFEGFEMNL